MYAIKCNGAGEVSSLNLTFNNLQEKVPAEIGLLSNSLGKFYVKGRMTLFKVSCSLIELPVGQACHSCSNHFCHSWFSRVHILLITEWLYLYNNKLTSTIPSELGLLSKLQHLVLDSNQFMGTIQTELGLLSNLEYLGLGGNQLTKTIPTSLVSLSLLSKSRSLLFHYMYLHYGFSPVRAHPLHYRLSDTL